MDLKSLITGITVSLTGLMGCHKAAAPAASSKTASAATQSKVKDLGIVQMTNDYETCVSFGPGKDCRMVPKILDRRDVQITLTFDLKKPDGTPAGLSIVQIEGNPEKPFDVSVGNSEFTFTPQVAAN